MACKLLQLQGWEMLIQVCTCTPGLQHFAVTFPFLPAKHVGFKFPFLAMIGKQEKTSCYVSHWYSQREGGRGTFNVSVMNNFVCTVEIPQCM